MRMLALRIRGRRCGFTMIELIVSMAIILILATLAVALLPRFFEQQKAAKGAGMLQGWLLIAKQRALRDRAATGLRLDVDANDPTNVRSLHFIQQPDDYTGGQLVSASGGTASFSGVDFTTYQDVQAGDHLEIRGCGVTYTIVQAGSSSLTVSPSITPPLAGSTSQYRIMRQARLLTSEQPLLLPDDIAIDLTLSGVDFGPGGSVLNPFAQIVSQGPIDILFTPAGGIIFQGNSASLAGSDRVVFWVRDTSYQNAADGTPGYLLGQPTLVGIGIRNGFVVSHPVSTGSMSPVIWYDLIRNNQSSGL